MRDMLAIIADVHANAVALDAVVADARALGVERFVCLGDIASLGPRPRETVERISRITEAAVRGNHDYLVLRTNGPDPEPERSPGAQRISDMVSWCAGRLSTREREYREHSPSCTVSPSRAAAPSCAAAALPGPSTTSSTRRPPTNSWRACWRV